VVPNPKLDKKYSWCSCGLSLTQPFCDYSHRGSAMKPVKFELLEKAEQMVLCGCKGTKEAPFCDQSCKGK
jgi:CDGSH-type Zn-finger protein